MDFLPILSMFYFGYSDISLIAFLFTATVEMPIEVSD